MPSLRSAISLNNGTPPLDAWTILVDWFATLAFTVCCPGLPYSDHEMPNQLDEELSRLDAALAEAERQALAVVSTVRQLRRQAAIGVLAGLHRRLQQLPAGSQPLAAALTEASRSFDYDAEAAFADGSYLAELQAAAGAKSLVLVEREGRITAFPLLLKLEPSMPAIRVGRKLERQLRPGVLTGLLKKAQDSATFNAATFLMMLFRAAAILAPVDGLAEEPRPGVVVPLLDIYDVLTLRPGQAAEYPREAFAVHVLQLDRAPDTLTKEGQRFSLPASTSSKGKSRLTVYDESGAEHIYVGISFRGNG